MKVLGPLLLLSLLLAPGARGATVAVGEGASIQAAIDAAADGDVIRVAAGTYAGDLDFRGKAIAVVGSGPTSVLRGSGGGPVVTFAGGEPAAAVLDAFTITGGVAARGGGIRIVGSSPTILRTVVVGNRAAERGSGVYLERSQAALYNNLIAYNGHDGGGDPHSVEIQDAAPVVANNTIVRGDSNGLIVRGLSAPLIVNNIIAYNGSFTDGAQRGRGICDFSGGRAVIRYNDFSRNRVGALLTDGTDYRVIRRAQAAIAPPRLEANRDGSPRFAERPHRRPPLVLAPEDFFPQRGATSRVIDRGDPDARYADRDGSRNDIGFTGGPFAAP